MSCDKEGLFVKIVGIYIDIDYWKVVEKVFMESEVFFCSLFEDSLLGILFCNMDGGIQEVNEMAFQLLGYFRQEFIYKMFNDLSIDEWFFEGLVYMFK